MRNAEYIKPAGACHQSKICHQCAARHTYQWQPDVPPVSPPIEVYQYFDALSSRRVSFVFDLRPMPPRSANHRRSEASCRQPNGSSSPPDIIATVHPLALFPFIHYQVKNRNSAGFVGTLDYKASSYLVNQQTRIPYWSESKLRQRISLRRLRW